jgi:hypothetical protein
MLDEHLVAIEESFGADGLAIYGPLEFGLDDNVRRIVEALREKDRHGDQLVVLVDTDGGYLDVVHRMVETIRHHYRLVSFVIPNAAYSAGTILAMSGDAIYMDYYSRLGPIDPQVPNDKGESVPALGYLNRYEALIARSKSTDDPLSMVEIQLAISGFDQAELYMYDQARKQSVALLREWLAKYKFKDWDKTETRGETVTDDLRKSRAEEVANILNNTERWHSHSTGISAATLKDELNVKIDPFGDHTEGIKRYHDLLKDYAGLNAHIGVVHAVGMYDAYHAH